MAIAIRERVQGRGGSRDNWKSGGCGWGIDSETKLHDFSVFWWMRRQQREARDANWKGVWFTITTDFSATTLELAPASPYCWNSRDSPVQTTRPGQARPGPRDRARVMSRSFSFSFSCSLTLKVWSVGALINKFPAASPDQANGKVRVI